jgi:hypothetical protein
MVGPSRVFSIVGPGTVFSIVGPGKVFSIVGPGGPETVFVTETKFVKVMVHKTSETYVEIENTVVPGTAFR